MQNTAVKPGYQVTELGVIPEGWSISTIKTTLNLVNGCAFKPSDWKEHGVPIIRIQNLNDANAMFNYFDGIVDNKYYISKGDLLFAWSGTTGTSFGARVWPGPNGILNQHIFKVIPKTNLLTSDYAYWVLIKVQQEIEKQAHGFKASFVHVKKADLEKVLLPLPPLPEQKAIATALSDVDALITAQEALIAKKRDIKTATMQQLLTGKVRLGAFGQRAGASRGESEDGVPPGYQQTELGVIPADWEIKELKNVCDLINGRAYNLSEWENHGTPVIRLQNLTGGNDYYYSNLKLPSHQYCDFGDLLFMWSATFGPRIWTGEKAIFHYHIWKVDPHKNICDNSFLYFKLDEITEKKKTSSSNGGTMLHVTKDSMEKTLVVMPSLDEQKAIAEVLSDMDAEITALEAQRDKTRAIKQGMMQELLTGKTRLLSVTP